MRWVRFAEKEFLKFLKSDFQRRVEQKSEKWRLDLTLLSNGISKLLRVIFKNQ